MKNVTCNIFWYISVYVWFDFRASIFFTILLYLCVLEAIWVLFWTMGGIISKFMVYFTLVVFNVKSFFWWKWSFFYLYPWIQPLTHEKNPGMLHTVGFEIFSRLWISNFHFPKMTWQTLTLKKSLGKIFHHMLAKKRICRTVSPILATSLEPLAHLSNIVSIFYRYYFGRHLSKLVQLVSFF